VTAQGFLFAMEVSSQGVPAWLLEDLVDQICRYAQCAEEARPGLRAALEKAVAEADGGGTRRCDVQFRAQNGTLEVMVSSNGGRIWQTKLPTS
jgi:hypothetical protein